MMVLHRSWCQLSQSKAHHRLLEAPQDCRDFKIQSIHFFPVFARLRRENAYFRVLWRT